MTRKSKKSSMPPNRDKLPPETDSPQSSVESWKARYEEMLDIALLPTQEAKDAAIAKIEIGKNSYVDSIRNKRPAFFDECPKELAIGTVKCATTGLGIIQEETARPSEESRRTRKGRVRKGSRAPKDKVPVSGHFPRAEAAMDSVLVSLKDVAGQALGLVRRLVFSPRFHLGLEIFTAVAVGSGWVAGDELPFRLAVLEIVLSVHGVLSLD
jgi:hypothetical protein